MKIDSVDLFYLSMPKIEDIGDGSQDAALVRVRAGGFEGWGECEASPLVTIAGLVAPMSHSACKSVASSVVGKQVESPADIKKINAAVRANSFDMLQADHVLSGIDVALWDLIGKKLSAPVWDLLGFERKYRKMPYASVLFGNTPRETHAKAKGILERGFRAAKFGWGPFGTGTALADAEQVAAAREGLGGDGILLVDAGTVWGDDVATARTRLSSLAASEVRWLEEPFRTGALEAYRTLADEGSGVKLAAGEGCHNFDGAKQLIDYGGVGYIQIDTGRIGGITTARQVAEYAAAKGVSYVNHTFTSHLALAASLAPFAGHERDALCEYPVEAKPLAVELTNKRIVPDGDGLIDLADEPGLGVSPNPEAIKKYLVETEIRVGGKVIYRTPAV